MSYLRVIIIFFVIFVLDQIIAGRFFWEFQISLLVPLICYLAVYSPLKEGLVGAFFVGFLFDISSLSNHIFMTIFLIAEVLIIYYLKKKHINFTSPLFLFLGSLFFLIIFIVIGQIMFNKINLSSIGYSLIGNIFVALILLPSSTLFKRLFRNARTT
ncbi:MAG: hypothetical protein NTZ65_02290 [Candidatus Berkelbacteria bacterium]|nr:hypothetical protein [Candidatus Berkelbacteria bacterium]